MVKKENIVNVNLVDEMKEAYGEYALAVICGRALPDIYDGLKPITRRILTAMKWLNLNPEGRYMKSARVEGETMGKLSPHGGSYGSMVTVAAPHSNNHPLIDGWGNWGSSTDGPAAPRYTECKLSSLSWEVLLEDYDICDKKPNYDGSLMEPVRLEAKIPIGLLNSQDGIGVGYATKIPPHNLRGVCKAIEALSSGDVKTASKNLIPDFPTGCDIVKDENLVKYLETGKGSIRLRSKMSSSQGPRNKVVLTFTNLPYQTNTEKIGEQVKKGLEDGKIIGVTEVRDLSDRSGDSLEITLKSSADTELSIALLYRYTDLESTFSANSLWVNGTSPIEISPVGLVSTWMEWRVERLKVKFEAEKLTLESRCHILEGLLKSLGSIDKVIKLIRSSSSKEEAREKLMAKPLSLSEEQANNVLEMRLRQLTSMDSDKLQTEYDENKTIIQSLESLIQDRELRVTYMVDEVKRIGERHGNARRSKLIEAAQQQTAKVEVKGKTVAPKRVVTRYLKVDKKKGVVEQLKKPRGADAVISGKDKLIVLGANGVFKKLPSRFSGPVFDEPTPILLVTSSGTETEYLVVFKLDSEVRKMKVSLQDMTRCTSLGKRLLPEGSEIVHFGTKGTSLSKKRGKAQIQITLANTKLGKPGQKGHKVGNTEVFAW